MRLYLVRHGATEWSELGRHTGRTDLPLTALGQQQARALRPVLAPLSFAHVFTSPLQRARQTAELAGFGAGLEASDLLLEMDYGHDEGKTRQEIQVDRPDWDIFTDGPRGGESVAEVARRTVTFLGSIASAEGDVLLFAHGHLLRILTTVFLRLPLAFGRQLELSPASVSILGFSHQVPSLQRWNYQP